jgi:hypothetical protein
VEGTNYSEEQVQWLRSKLGLRIRVNNGSTTEVVEDFSAMPSEELMLKAKKDLMNICKTLGHSTSGNKEVLVTRIKSGVNTVNSSRKTELERLANCWFMRPLVNKSALKLGSKNEGFVFKSVTNISVINPDVQVHEGPFEFGLVRRSDKPWLATSVDGLVELSLGGEAHFQCVIEIKTMTTPNTVNEARAIANGMNKLSICYLGDDTFLKCVKPEYRVQCMHHACVMGVNAVLFIVASDHNIIYMLIIDLPIADVDMYESILDPLRETLDWIYGTAPFPTECFCEGLGQSGYHVDVHSIRLQLALWKNTHALIRRHEKKPLPPCKYIVPTGIAYWNKTKGFVDVMSRLLSHMKIPFQKGGPVLQLMFRFLSIMTVNGHLATSLLSLSDEDFNGEESYNDIRKKLSNEFSLNNYVRTLAQKFELPGCLTYESNTPRQGDQNDIFDPGFGKLPINRDLRPGEITTFKLIIEKKRKLGDVFNKGLPKKIRLQTSYRHHMVDVEKQGRCVLCLVEHRVSYPKFQCKTCGVFLCRTPREGSRLSCFEKWHTKNDLTR